jgi:hypothetical protein
MQNKSIFLNVRDEVKFSKEFVESLSKIFFDE